MVQGKLKLSLIS